MLETLFILAMLAVAAIALTLGIKGFIEGMRLRDPRLAYLDAHDRGFHEKVRFDVCPRCQERPFDTFGIEPILGFALSDAPLLTRLIDALELEHGESVEMGCAICALLDEARDELGVRNAPLS